MLIHLLALTDCYSYMKVDTIKYIKKPNAGQKVRAFVYVEPNY